MCNGYTMSKTNKRKSKLTGVPLCIQWKFIGSHGWRPQWEFFILWSHCIQWNFRKFYGTKNTWDRATVKRSVSCLVVTSVNGKWWMDEFSGWIQGMYPMNTDGENSWETTSLYSSSISSQKPCVYISLQSTTSWTCRQAVQSSCYRVSV